MSRVAGVVAGGSRATVEAGAALLAAGGNAVDAAVAACFAAAVAEPMMASLVGAGLMVVRHARGGASVLDFFGNRPLRYDGTPRGHSIEAQLGSGTLGVAVGEGTAGVPGMIPGLCGAAERWGKRRLSEIVAPAARVAREGVVVTGWLADSLQFLSPVIGWSDGPRRHYGIPDEARGRLLRYPFQSWLLQDIGVDWREAYAGLVSAIVAGFGPDAGGFLCRDDFENYRVTEGLPAVLDYHDARMLFPSPMGRAQAEIAGWLRRVEPSLPEMKRAQGAGHTTHISTMDAAGNAVSVTLTHGTGAGVFIPGTDIMMNNLLGEAHVVGGAPRPESDRLSTLMSPTILSRGGALACFGTGGSERIPSVVAQVASRLVEFHDSPEEAVLAPRSYFDGSKVYEEVLLDEVDAVERRPSMAPPMHSHVRELAPSRPPLVEFAGRHAFFGGVHLAYRHPNGRLEAVGDARRGGASVIAVAS